MANQLLADAVGNLSAIAVAERKEDVDETRSGQTAPEDGLLHQRSPATTARSLNCRRYAGNAATNYDNIERLGGNTHFVDLHQTSGRRESGLEAPPRNSTQPPEAAE